MQKEIATKEQQRLDYQKDTERKYGTRTQLEKEKDKLLTEKLRIENATGVTAAREHEQQQKRDAVIQQRESHIRFSRRLKCKQ